MRNPFTEKNSSCWEEQKGIEMKGRVNRVPAGLKTRRVFMFSFAGYCGFVGQVEESNVNGETTRRGKENIPEVKGRTEELSQEKNFVRVFEKKGRLRIHFGGSSDLLLNLFPVPERAIWSYGTVFEICYPKLFDGKCDNTFISKNRISYEEWFLCGIIFFFSIARVFSYRWLRAVAYLAKRNVQ